MTAAHVLLQQAYAVGIRLALDPATGALRAAVAPEVPEATVAAVRAAVSSQRAALVELLRTPPRELRAQGDDPAFRAWLAELSTADLLQPRASHRRAPWEPQRAPAFGTGGFS